MNVAKYLVGVFLITLILSMSGARAAGRGPRGVSAYTPLSDIVGELHTPVAAETTLLRETSNAVVYLAGKDLTLTGSLYVYGGVISKNGVYSISGSSGQTVIGSDEMVLDAPTLTISGNTLGEGDLTITGLAQMGPTAINGTLMVNSSSAQVGANGYPGQPGGVGILTLGGNGGSGELGLSGAGGSGGPGGNGELFLGSFGGAGGNGVLSIGAQYAVATKHSSSPSDVASLTYQLELSPTWETAPIISVNAYVFSGATTANTSYCYNETFFIGLNNSPESVSSVSADVSYSVYENFNGATPTIISQSNNLNCTLDGSVLTITLPVPSGGGAPYFTAIQFSGPVMRVS